MVPYTSTSSAAELRSHNSWLHSMQGRTLEEIDICRMFIFIPIKEYAETFILTRSVPLKYLVDHIPCG